MVNRFVLPRLPRATLGALVTMAVLTVGAQNAHAQSNWNGGTGDWNVSTNWTPNGVPNSTSTDVSITGTSSIPSSVTLDNLTAEVHNLSLDSFSTLSISAGQELYVAGPSLSNAGQIKVGVVGNPGYLALDSSTVTLSGGGIVSLNNPASQLVGFGDTETLVNKDNTIQGQGLISDLISHTNQATVNANVSGGTLLINEVTTTNTGTLEATGGGTLHINDSTVTNTNGTISTDSSSSVMLSGSTIIGGNLTSATGAVIHGNDTALQGVTLTPGSTYSVDPGLGTFLTGDLTNKGTVLIGGSSAAAALYADVSTVNLSGGGTITLNNANSQLAGFGGTETLVNKDNTIQGQGSISALASFQNQGTVLANVSGGTLSIDGVTNTTNSGTFQASSGSTLLVNGMLTNYKPSTSTLTGGTYNAYSGAIESLTGQRHRHHTRRHHDQRGNYPAGWRHGEDRRWERQQHLAGLPHNQRSHGYAHHSERREPDRGCDERFHQQWFAEHRLDEHPHRGRGE